LAGGAAVAIWPATPPPRPNRLALPAGLLLLAGAVFFGPLLTEAIMAPVVEQLDPGLTPFGLLEVWPWIGVGALDSAHSRTALLPGVALAPLFVVVLAITWLLQRLVSPRAAGEPSALGGQAATNTALSRIWWLPKRRG
jgi:hypothetical protein